MSERVLIVDDEKLIRWSVGSRLRDEGLEVAEAENAEAAFALLDDESFDLMLLDYRLPDASAIDVLERLHTENRAISVIVMTAFGTVDNAVQAMKLGALDFLTKPVDLGALMVLVQRALETTRLRREVARLRNEQYASHGGLQLVGKSAALAEVTTLIQKICASEASTILIEGESGTGKDLAAKAIHYLGPRADKPFVNITCSALPETLLESELFGHERGAFTDARVQKKGLLEVANGGSAFLDEIGEMGLSMQAKLLRFLEDKAFRRVGGTRDIRVDVRIIAATNLDLQQAVHAGRFRADLFYRLKVIPMRMPALRERREDVPLLVQHFLDHYNRELRKKTAGVEPDAMERLVAYDWPGNVRELRNTIERIMILENKPRIELSDLPKAITEHPPSPSAAEGTAPGSRATLEEIERSAIAHALHQAQENQVKAAKLLGISRDTLRYRMKKYGLL
jgi:DNA-binding NtrC family response regulator